MVPTLQCLVLILEYIMILGMYAISYYGITRNATFEELIKHVVNMQSCVLLLYLNTEMSPSPKPVRIIPQQSMQCQPYCMRSSSRYSYAQLLSHPLFHGQICLHTLQGMPCGSLATHSTPPHGQGRAFKQAKNQIQPTQ